jgi:hypothetical protein
MGFLDNLFNKKRGSTVVLQPKKPQKQPERKPSTELVTQSRDESPAVLDDYTPDMLDLGWYYSERKQQFQMAKIPLKDRATHMYVIGASGSGKTKFLEFPIQQDIKQGNGFCIIDPHGDLVEETRGFLACYYHETQNESIFDRVIIVDPTDPTYTVGFNVLEIPRGLLPLNRRKS